MRNNLRQMNVRNGEWRIRPLNDSSVFDKVTIAWYIGKLFKKTSLVRRWVFLVVFLFANCCFQAQKEKYDLNLPFQKFFVLEDPESLCSSGGYFLSPGYG